MPDKNPQYSPFPSFSDWSRSQLDFSAVGIANDAIAKIGPVTEDLRRAAVQAVKNAAAIETGAIENLYQLERGITITAAVQAAQIESIIQGQQETARGLIESQLAAYDYVLDLVTGQRPLAQAWIRELHQMLCSKQPTYKVLVDGGHFQDRQLQHGAYKSEPNHVQLPSGAVHYYAPVGEVTAEMDRLLSEMSSKEFLAAHAADQTSYAHYAFVAIHPFSDGNGRVARAFASIFTYRKYGVPLLITVDQRDEYFDALTEADAGDPKSFRIFIAERVSQSLRLMVTSIAAARRGPVAERINALKQVYETRGGYLQVEMDQAAMELLNAIKKQLEKVVEDNRGLFSGLNMGCSDVLNSGRDPSSKMHRPMYLFGARLVRLQLNTLSPAEANFVVDIAVEIPKDAARGDTFRIFALGTLPTLELNVEELLPKKSMMADILLEIYIGDLFGAAIEELQRSSADALKRKGFQLNAKLRT